jgi:hypothetical protein
MIAENLIRSDLPDPNTEPELYQLVLTHQIHTCNPNKCDAIKYAKRNFLVHIH